MLQLLSVVIHKLDYVRSAITCLVLRNIQVLLLNICPLLVNIHFRL